MVLEEYIVYNECVYVYSLTDVTYVSVWLVNIELRCYLHCYLLSATFFSGFAISYYFWAMIDVFMTNPC